ncbi:MAG: hypothetical protein AB1938_01740 [Myxococcota bacterium]
MKYLGIALPPLFLFVVVVVLGVSWTKEPSRLVLVAEASHAETEREQGALELAHAVVPRPAVDEAPPREVDERVPRHLAAPLKAVAPDISLCVSQRLTRDRGPIDVDVIFTPVEGGGFAPGTRVFTNWRDPEVEACIAEVFEESTFMPTNAERFERAEFVFHFPDDALAGLLGLTYSPFH